MVNSSSSSSSSSSVPFLLRHLPLEYSTIYSTVFSKDGEFLAGGNDKGQIAVFDIDSILSSSRKDGNSELGPFFIFKDQDFGHQRLSALTSNKDYLLSGSTTGVIHAYAWSNLRHKENKLQFKFSVSSTTSSSHPNEINWLTVQEGSTAELLLVASSDNLIHIFDLETRNQILTLKGHDNFIHSLSCCPISQRIASASEDGSVRLWDHRLKRPCVIKLVPSDKGCLERGKFGKWISAVDVSEDWLVCGGGPSAALWHLKSLAPSDPLPPHDHPVTVTTLLHSRIVIGGHVNKMTHTDYNGHILAEVETSFSCLYSVSHVDKPSLSVLAAAGSSSKIDLCTSNFSYKDITLTFPNRILGSSLL